MVVSGKDSGGPTQIDIQAYVASNGNMPTLAAT